MTETPQQPPDIGPEPRMPTGPENGTDDTEGSEDDTDSDENA
jgi:hypothetical protein